MITSTSPILESQRLFIRPLSYYQLVQYIRFNNSLEHELGLKFCTRTMSAELVEAFEDVILPSVAKPENNYLFSTLWTIIHKEKKIMVGDICFKGEPNEAGEIEIGYGTYTDFQNQGYMTEAIKELIQWAFRQQGVFSILAETEKNNFPSSKVLMRHNFLEFKETENRIWWRLDRRLPF